MSDNKGKYFTVTGEFLVKANNKKDAALAVRRARVSETQVLDEDVTVERVSATHAHTMLTD